MKYCLCVIFLLLSLQNQVLTQELSPLEKEAPPTLFETRIGDADVELYSMGSWTMGLAGGTGFSFAQNTGALSQDTFPGFISRQPFYIEPDITLSLWLKKRFFFETTILKDFEFNSILFGYKGGPTDFLKSVLIGNNGITMNPYALVEVPDMPKQSLGVSAIFESGTSRHEIMARLEPSGMSAKIFIGNNESIVENLELYQYIPGRLFVFPDRDLDGAEILVETAGSSAAGSSAAGTFAGTDGRYYRLMDPGEGVINLNEGWLLLENQPPGRLLLYYTAQGRPLGDPELGKGSLCGISGTELDPELEALDFSWNAGDYLGEPWSSKKVGAEGKDYLLLYAPGFFNPFESCNLYAVSGELPEEPENTRVFLVHKADLSGTPAGLDFSADTSGLFVSVIPYAGGVRAPGNRYPFSAVYPDLYGPSKKSADVYADEFLSINSLQPVDDFVLGPDVLPGSVTVMYNGRKEERFTLDYTSGIISFDFPIAPDDRIETTFALRSSSGENSGGLVNTSGKNRLTLAFGNRFLLGQNNTLEAGTSLGWNLNQDRYVYADNPGDGSLLVSAGVSHEGEKVKASLKAGLSLRTGNTTGILRAASMEDAGFSIPVSRDMAYPSSVPGLPADESGSFLADGSRRGELYYKDYVSYGVLGAGTLMPYTWALPEAQEFRYENYSPAGPYTATSGGEISSSEVLVLDFHVTENSNWVGAQIPVRSGDQAADLSLVSSINLTCRLPEHFENLRVVLHIGTLGEDLDGDGVLDQEQTEYSRGFAFNDAVSGNTLLVGAGPGNSGNGILDTEDTNGNGFLDLEQKEKILVRDLTFSSGEWTSLSLPVSATDRELLTAVTAIRIMVLSDGSDVSGRFLIGDISFNGSRFRTIPPEPATIQVRQIPETEQTYPAGTALTAAYPEIADTFFSESTGNTLARQKVLELSWSGNPPGGKAEIMSFLPPLPLADYKSLVFYYRTPLLDNPDESEIELSVTGRDGEGFLLRFKPGMSAEWQKGSVDLKRLTFTAGGVEIPDALVTRTETGGTLSALRLAVSGSGSGSVSFDELYLEQADLKVSGGITGDFYYENSDFLISLGTFQLLRTFKFHQTVSFYGTDFPYLPEGASSASFVSYSEAETNLAYTGLGIRFQVRWDGISFYLSGGHNLLLPALEIGSPVSLNDFYDEKNAAGSSSFFHSIKLQAGLPGILSSMFSADSGFSGDRLSQHWAGSLSSAWSPPFSLRAASDFSLASGDFVYAPGAYFDTWARSFTYIVPRISDAASERSFSASFLAQVSGTLPAFSLKADTGSLVFGTDIRRQRNRAGIELSVPLAVPLGLQEKLTLTPSYKRLLTHILPAGLSPLFESDFALLGQTFATQQYFYRNIPFQELFSPEPAQTFSLQSEGAAYSLYEPSFSLAVERAYSSRIIDLIVPSLYRAELKKSFRRQEDSLSFETTYSLGLTTAAINLFGRLGAYPFLLLYDTDEITWSAALDLTYDGTGTAQRIELVLQQYGSFLQGRDNLFTFENRFSKVWIDTPSWSDEITLALTWVSPTAIRLNLDYLKDKGDPYFKSREHFSLGLAPRGQDDPSTGVNIMAGHETSLVIDDAGYGKAFLDLGFDSSAAQLLRFGFRAGIEVKLTF